MSYKENVRRSLEIQGYDEWLGPKALLAEKERMEKYLREKSMTATETAEKSQERRRKKET